MAVMVLALNAALYVIALSLSLAVLTPVPEPAGGPPDELWTEFDRARAVWERERAPVNS